VVEARLSPDLPSFTPRPPKWPFKADRPFLGEPSYLVRDESYSNDFLNRGRLQLFSERDHRCVWQIRHRLAHYRSRGRGSRLFCGHVAQLVRENMGNNYNQYMAGYMNRRYKRRREWAVELLGGVCRHCGKPDDGTHEFDHINPTDKLVPIASLWSANLELFLNELECCQLLCKACHIVKTRKDLGQNDARIVHGTLSSYRYCRCDACRQAKSEWSRQAYIKRKEQQRQHSL
jgi:5-methylcytosine-specific restriction endonuclease McrA